jgi:hypothetical protein
MSGLIVCYYVWLKPTEDRPLETLPLNLIIAHLTNFHKEKSRGVYTMPDSKGEELRSLLRFEVSTKVRGERFADQNITGM